MMLNQNYSILKAHELYQAQLNLESVKLVELIEARSKSNKCNLNHLEYEI